MDHWACPEPSQQVGLGFVRHNNNLEFPPVKLFAASSSSADSTFHLAYRKKASAGMFLPFLQRPIYLLPNRNEKTCNQLNL